MKNPSIMKMAKMAGDSRTAMKMKNEAAMKMKKAAMKMKDPMDMKKDPMMMKKDPMKMKKNSAMDMKKEPMKMKKGSAMDMKKDPMKMKKKSPMKKDSDGDGIPDFVDADTKGAKIGPKNKKDPYAEAKKRDPKLPEYIKQRKGLKKGTVEYNRVQNKINKAYGKGPMRGVEEKATTLGSRKVTKISTPGVERLKTVNTNTKRKTKRKDLIKGTVTTDKQKRGRDKQFDTADDKFKSRTRKMFRETKLGKTKLGQKLVAKKNR